LPAIGTGDFRSLIAKWNLTLFQGRARLQDKATLKSK